MNYKLPQLWRRGVFGLPRTRVPGVIDEQRWCVWRPPVGYVVKPYCLYVSGACVQSFVIQKILYRGAELPYRDLAASLFAVPIVPADLVTHFPCPLEFPGAIRADQSVEILWRNEGWSELPVEAALGCMWVADVETEIREAKR